MKPKKKDYKEKKIVKLQVVRFSSSVESTSGAYMYWRKGRKFYVTL